MLLAPDPGFATVRQTGTRARGLTYEKRVGQWLRAECDRRNWTLTDHPWLASPWGVCQPDFIIERPGLRPLIVEAKLTWTDCTMQAYKYKWAVVAATELPPALFVQVCRRLLPASPDPADSLDDVTDGSVILLWV